MRKAQWSGEAELQINDTDKAIVIGYKWHTPRRLLFYLLYLVTLGIVPLIFYWRPKWQAKLMCMKASLGDSPFMLICDSHCAEFRHVHSAGEGWLPDVQGKYTKVSFYKYMTFRKQTYILNGVGDGFDVLRSLDGPVPLQRFHDLTETGLTSEEAAQRARTHGANIIDINLKPIWLLVFREVLTPFYLFQAFSVTLWYNDEYYYYASIIVAMCLISVVLNIYLIRKQELEIRNMVRTTSRVIVSRDGEQKDISSAELVPGDLVTIVNGTSMHYDAVLTAGTCVLNEAMLTGESIPVTKTPLGDDDEFYDRKHHNRHTLYAGTTVLQTRVKTGQDVQAIVIRTGFATSKGQLIRSIMYPKPIDFELQRDLGRYIALMSIIAAFGMAYALWILTEQGATTHRLIVRTLDVVTIAVPPALPAALTIGILFAHFRLKKRGIYCISPTTINTSGGVDTCVFDKTGTLTEEGLGFLETRPVEVEPNGVYFSKPRLDMESVPVVIESGHQATSQSELILTSATCHSLSHINEELTGDPMDLVMFNETGWKIRLHGVTSTPGGGENIIVWDESASVANEFEIVRQFQFSSTLQRQSVVIKETDSGDLTIRCKGAPEKVASVVAMAHKELIVDPSSIRKATRESLECELIFDGFLVLENPLKPETEPVIAHLHSASIKTVMATGDNVLTAISIARECGILKKEDELFVIDVIDGRVNMRPYETNGSISNGRSINQSTLLNGDSEMQSADNIKLYSDEFSLNYKKEKVRQPKLAMTGAAFSRLFRNSSLENDEETPFIRNLKDLLKQSRVFARMSPDEKTKLIEWLQASDCVVAMCGDGANDCGALKSAHAGISLSEAEASIASPFTSSIPNISCVAELISQGRGSLVTSFGIVKYMAAYSLTQFLTVCLLYLIDTTIADLQFLYIDLFLMTFVVVFFGTQEPSKRLAHRSPSVHMLSPASFISLMGNMTIVFICQAFLFVFTSHQPWFTPYVKPNGDERTRKCYQGTVLFCASMYQYIALALLSNKSAPHRKSLATNWYLCLALLTTLAVSLWVSLGPPEWMIDPMDLQPVPSMGYRVFVVIVGTTSGAFCYAFEFWVVDILLRHYDDMSLLDIFRPGGKGRPSSSTTSSTSSKSNSSNLAALPTVRMSNGTDQVFGINSADRLEWLRRYIEQINGLEDEKCDTLDELHGQLNESFTTTF